MNYLAHAFLARSSPEFLIGGLMGDFIKGAVPDTLSPAVRSGIVLHRRIDRFTDDHAILVDCRNLVSPQRRRYAGVMMDIFFDHFLARHWHFYTADPLEEFTAQVYEILYEHWNLLPPRLQRVLPHMATHDWLGSYRHVDAIHDSINGISLNRLKRSNSLLHGADELEWNYSSFEISFHRFFPQLIEFVQSQSDAREQTG